MNGQTEFIEYLLQVFSTGPLHLQEHDLLFSEAI